MKATLGIYVLLFFVPVAVSVRSLEDTALFLAATAAGVAALITAVVGGISVRKSMRDLVVVFVGLCVCVAAIFAVARWHWPLRLEFAASRSALELAAAEVRAGRTFNNRRVGLFYVRRAELSRTGIPCLWVDTDPAGPTGLVQTSADVLPFNLWSTIALSDRWQLISED